MRAKMSTLPHSCPWKQTLGNAAAAGACGAPSTESLESWGSGWPTAHQGRAGWGPAARALSRASPSLGRGFDDAEDEAAPAEKAAGC